MKDISYKALNEEYNLQREEDFKAYLGYEITNACKDYITAFGYEDFKETIKQIETKLGL